MKNLFLIIATLISFTATTFASNIVEVSLDAENASELILSKTYNAESEDVALVFETVVSMVQIFNANGDLEMTFPVGSNELNLGLSLFTPGTYKVGFMVEGLEDVQFTNLIIK